MMISDPTGGHPISTTHFTSKMSGIEGASQALTLPNIAHTRNGLNYSSLTGQAGRNLNHSTDLSKPHNFSRLTDPSSALHPYESNKKALTKFIKKTIKDNPEPFRGYLEVSNAT